MKPPIVPHQGRGIDTVNFRNVKESASVDISGTRSGKGTALKTGAMGVALDSGMGTPGGGADGAVPDPFEEFNSVTLHHDGDDHGLVMNGYH